MAIRILLFSVIFLTSYSFSQEQFGASASNYTPTLSALTNPSSMLDAKTWLDIHIVGAGVYGINNLAYIKRSGIIPIVRQGNIDNSTILLNKERKSYKAYSRGFTSVLSGVWSQGDHAAGLFFNARSFTMVRGISGSIVSIVDSAILGNPIAKNTDFDFSDMYVSSVNFGEVQLSYAYTFYKNQRDMFMGGISLKKFVPLAGAALNLRDLRFNLQSDSVFNYLYANADGMYVAQSDNYFKGGMGLDLGFTYQKMESNATRYFPNSKKMGCRSMSYKYKVGVSIIDIGSVKFNYEEVERHGININLPDTYNANYSLEDEENALDILADLDTIPNDENVERVNKIQLPTALSVQFDYNLWQSKVYAFGSLMQGIPVSKDKFGMRRANSLMVGIRYESKIFDIAMPFSMYDYTRPQLGLSMRIYFLTIGTDKLISMLGGTDVYGGDIYAHIKIPIYYNPSCRKKVRSNNKSQRSKRSARKKVNCDAY